MSGRRRKTKFIIEFVLRFALIYPIMYLLFRKFLLDRVVDYGEAVAVILSGVMFGLYHANLSQFMATCTQLGIDFFKILLENNF